MSSLAEMRARLQQLNQRTSKKNDLFKAKDEHDLRLLPDPDGGDPFVVRTFHYELGGASCLCPRANFGKPCKVCDFCDKLKAWKDPTTGQDKPERERKADFEIFRKIQPTEKALVRCIERTKEGFSDEGPKWWSPGFTNNNKILELCSDAELKEAVGLSPDSDDGLNVLFDVTNAFELHVSFKKKNNEDGKGNKKNANITEITKTSLKPKPLSKDKREIEKILSACKNINDVYPEQSSAEVAAIFDKWIGSSSDEASTEGGVEKYGSNTSEDAAVKGGKSIDEAFGDLANE